MSKANYDDWRSKTSFSDWERTCLLANVEPGQEMSVDELSEVQRVRYHIEAMRAFLAKPAEAALFKKLLAF